MLAAADVRLTIDPAGSPRWGSATRPRTPCSTASGVQRREREDAGRHASPGVLMRTSAHAGHKLAIAACIAVLLAAVPVHDGQRCRVPDGQRSHQHRVHEAVDGGGCAVPARATGCQRGERPVVGHRASADVLDGCSSGVTSRRRGPAPHHGAASEMQARGAPARSGNPSASRSALLRPGGTGSSPSSSSVDCGGPTIRLPEERHGSSREFRPAPSRAKACHFDCSDQLPAPGAVSR